MSARPIPFRRSRSSRQVRFGYTLLEMLVVIALIGMLVATLIPSLQKSMSMARSTICMSNLHSLGTALFTYRIENNGWLPIEEVIKEEDAVDPGGVAGADEKSKAWYVKLFPTYLADPMILTCPEDPFRYRMQRSVERVDHLSVEDYLSFGMNDFIMSAGGGFVADLDTHMPTRPLDTILLADLGPDVVASATVSPLLGGPPRNKSLLSWDDGYDPFAASIPIPWLTTRHGKGIHVLTVAGGVRSARTAWEGPGQRLISPYYSDCAAGGCPLCLELRVYHYSFAKDHLYWWTGPAPIE